uniref:Uncharacterized protein n=1 Tax=Zea mays TaxID=4577 RepID=C4J3P4_MAIZE|nr:unknown [Zea mays]
MTEANEARVGTFHACFIGNASSPHLNVPDKTTWPADRAAIEVEEASSERSGRHRARTPTRRRIDQRADHFQGGNHTTGPDAPEASASGGPAGAGTKGGPLGGGGHGRGLPGDVGRAGAGGVIGRIGAGGGGGAAEVRRGARVQERGGVPCPCGGRGGLRPGPGAHRHDARRPLPQGLHGSHLLVAQARLLPGVALLPLPRCGGGRRRAGGLRAPGRRGGLLPVPELRDLPVPRRRGRRAHLRVRARRARGAAQLRAEPPRRPAPALRAARDIPRLRRARRRRRAVALGDAAARRRGRRRARVLPRQLLALLHRRLLGRPRPRRQGLRRPPPRALLLQHGCHGHRPPEVARRQLPPAHRALDGDAEGEEDLRAWLLAPLPARLRRRDRGRRPPVEPARLGRRQRVR